jgi:DNA-directed RNA polymerase subunit RPC12/RpoP
MGSKSKCQNCGNDIAGTRTKKYSQSDPWNRNVIQAVSERVCPECGHRNQKKEYTCRKV